MFVLKRNKIALPKSLAIVTLLWLSNQKIMLFSKIMLHTNILPLVFIYAKYAPFITKGEIAPP